MKTKNSIKRSLKTGIATIALALTAASLHADGFITPGLTGSTQFEGWSDLTATNYPTYPGFLGANDPWPSPIAPTDAGSAGNAVFNKVAGGGYPASTSIYNFLTPGTYSVSNSTPLADLETLVFQVQLGDGDAFFTSSPVLNYNGGSQSLNPQFTNTNAGDIGFINPQSGLPTVTTNFQFQWDLSSVGSITDFEMLWTTDAHVTTHALQLHSSDTFAQVVPEPSTYAALFGLVALGAVVYSRRRR